MAKRGGAASAANGERVVRLLAGVILQIFRSGPSRKRVAETRFHARLKGGQFLRIPSGSLHFINSLPDPSPARL